jgi:hypothetical protein
MRWRGKIDEEEENDLGEDDIVRPAHLALSAGTYSRKQRKTRQIGGPNKSPIPSAYTLEPCWSRHNLSLHFFVWIFLVSIRFVWFWFCFFVFSHVSLVSKKFGFGKCSISKNVYI